MELLFLVLQGLLVVQAQEKAAVVSPAHNYTASLGSYVTFNCTTTGADEVWWMVDGLRATTHEIAGRDIQRTKYSYTSTGIETELRVAATVENNETSIYCFGIVFDSKNFFSETLTFHVQGLLASPPNLTVDSASGDLGGLELSWMPPFTLNITDVEPDISTYTVRVNGSTHMNTSKTHLTVDRPCFTTTYSVSAWNAVGEGNKTDIQYTYPPECVEMLKLHQVLPVRFDSGGSPEVTLSFMVLDACYHENPFPIGVRLCIGAFCWSYQMQPVTNKATVSDEHTQDLEATISGLPSSQHLTAELEVDGKCQETSETTRELEFSTHGLQNVELKTAESSLCFNCSFADGAPHTDSFYILLLEADTGKAVTSLAVNRKEGEEKGENCVAQLPTGNYSVYVYEMQQHDPAFGKVNIMGSQVYFSSISWTTNTVTEDETSTMSPSSVVYVSPTLKPECSESATPLLVMVLSAVAGACFLLAVLVCMGCVLALACCHGKARDKGKVHLELKDKQNILKLEESPYKTIPADAAHFGANECPAYGVLGPPNGIATN